MRRAVILALGTALGAVLCAPAIAQTAQATKISAPAAPAASAAYVAPRTAFGQPDLMGFWSNSSLTPLTRPAKLKDQKAYSEAEVKALEDAVELEVVEGQAPTDPNSGAEARQKATNERPEFAAAGGAVGGYNRFWLDPGSHVMRVNGEPRTSLLTTPNGQFPARKPQTAAAPAASRPSSAAMDYESRGQGDRCIIGFGRNGGPPMFANGFYNNNYQIVQTPEHVLIEVEMNHDTRIVRLNAKHTTSTIRPYFGDSIGWWEGDTLVVETINLPRSQAFMGSWENLKVTERFKRVAADRLYYSFSVEDPSMWDAAWGGEYEFHPLDGHIFEYACHEGNYALPGILAGNKFDEEAKEAKEAAEAKAKAPKGKSKN